MGSSLSYCVLVPGTLALHLLYLDEIATTVWFTLCFAVSVTTGKQLIRVSLSGMKNQHGLGV